MSHISPQVDAQVLADIRRAAFELRQTDPQTRLDEDLLRWAAEERLFDALHEEDEDPQEDWVRFHSLWTRLRQLEGRAAEAARGLAEAEAAGQLSPRDAAALRRDALEEAGDVAGAAAQAGRVLDPDAQAPSGKPEAAVDV